jgi:4-hydroxybenzoate polyprenyltransferase
MTGVNHPERVVNIASAFVKELRPSQWYKQGVMLLSIVFSRNLMNLDAWGSLALGIIAFTAIAGALYVFNDIRDLEADRRHPRKRHRPIASDQISPTSAATFAVVVGLFGLALTISLGPLFTGILLTYVGQNVLYSLYLKKVLFVEAIVIANGFVFRAIAGVVAIDVVLSPWLILSTFLLALVLVFGKRLQELRLDSANNTRAVLDGYEEMNPEQLFTVSLSALLICYSLYTFFRTDLLMMTTIPFAFYGVFRYYYLIQTTDVAVHPQYLLTDRPTVCNLLLWGVLIVAILYSVPQQLWLVVS